MLTYIPIYTYAKQLYYTVGSMVRILVTAPMLSMLAYTRIYTYTYTHTAVSILYSGKHVQNSGHSTNVIDAYIHSNIHTHKAASALYSG